MKVENEMLAKETSQDTDTLIGDIIENYEGGKGYQREGLNLPSREEATNLQQTALGLLFPGHFGLKGITTANSRYLIGCAIYSLKRELIDLTDKCLRYECTREEKCPIDICTEQAIKTTNTLMKQIPQIRRTLLEDVEAAYEGDPAARSIEGVITSYPITIAIATHRIAHQLYRENVPYLPRMLNEVAHSQTGIDIHPGAQIGRAFFIDHGSGTVIGETAVIGNNVKLYQGVTLGALSFPRDEGGKIIRTGKRHPTIEDNVVIYSGATILGGNTIIGRGSIIGGNCWIAQSVPPNTRVIFDSPNQTYNAITELNKEIVRLPT